MGKSAKSPHDRDEEGVYEWSHGTLVTYIDWASGEPSASAQDCGLINTGGSGEFSDRSCGLLRNFVCEDGFGVNPDDPDSDGDGLNDNEELNIYGTHPNSCMLLLSPVLHKI